MMKAETGFTNYCHFPSCMINGTVCLITTDYSALQINQQQANGKKFISARSQLIENYICSVITYTRDILVLT